MSSGNYADDRKFGDSFMNEVKAILGQFLLKDDFTDEDRERNTDLIVLKMDTKRIGVRIRRYEYCQDYGEQFTIRFERASGAKTEFEKIMEGWGDYFFYGFADETGEHLIKWFIGDFCVFRKYISNLLGDCENEFLLDRANKIFKEQHRICQNFEFRGSRFLWFEKKEVQYKINNRTHCFVVADSDNWPPL